MYTVSNIVEIGKAREMILNFDKIESGGDDVAPETLRYPDEFEE